MSVRPGKKCGGEDGVQHPVNNHHHTQHIYVHVAGRLGKGQGQGPQIRVGSENASLLPSHDERVCVGGTVLDVDGYDCEPGDLMDRARNELRDSSDNNGYFVVLSFCWIMLVSVAFVFPFATAHVCPYSCIQRLGLLALSKQDGFMR